MTTPKTEDSANEMPLLQEQFAASALGAYVTDHAIIRLSRDASFWLEENEPTLERLAVFMHEYSHYLHNFSTVSGIYGFVAMLRLLAIFMNTVDEDGKSAGSSGLSIEAATELDGIMKWRRHLAGKQVIPVEIAPTFRSDIQVQESKWGSETVQLAAQTLELKSVSIVMKLGSSDAAPVVDIELGTHVLTEGLAWEIERLLFETDGRDTEYLEVTVPTWPYKIPRVFLEHAVGGVVSSEIVAKVILLALQSTDPGVAFVEITGALKAGSKHKSHVEIVESLKNVVKNSLSEMNERLSSNLRVEANRYSSRPPLHRAFGAMIKWATDYLDLRAHDPFFELGLVSTTDRNALVSMIKAFPPCPIIQETGTLAQDFELVILSDTEPDTGLLQDLGVAQSLMHFAARHYRPSAIVPTSQVQASACRFFGSCKVPLTISAPEICRQRPWESFKPSDAQGCWYASGVRLSRSIKKSA